MRRAENVMSRGDSMQFLEDVHADIACLFDQPLRRRTRAFRWTERVLSRGFPGVREGVAEGVLATGFSAPS